MLGRSMNDIFKRVLLGRPISSHEEAHHRLSKTTALAVFSSDALSSSAYATDEILRVLILAGALALSFSVPVGLAVATVLAVVITSYRQTVKAYPKGGGAYRVAHDNLGPFPGLIAASSILIDYILTVAVSVAAGVGAVGAAFPEVRGHRVALALAVVALITALNLRGLKESGTIFAIPTYGFLLSMGVMIVIGVVRVATGSLTPYPQTQLDAVQPVTIFLILWAFSSGSTALTGVEAIADGVPAFRRPEAKNASQTLLILGILLSFLFLGITFLANKLRVDPELIEHGKTATSQIAAKVFGARHFMFYVVQAATSLILFLAANTAFADFPRLSSILAKDRYLPRVLANRGDRLAFSNGIVILAVAAGAVLINYRADAHDIIPLYVIGVFTSFTLSQSGMVVRWNRLRKREVAVGRPPPPGWKRSLAINAFGALTTFVVLIIVTITKFADGAWQVIVLIPAVALLLRRIGLHFAEVDKDLQSEQMVPRVLTNRVILVVTRFRGATKALALCRSIAPSELHIATLGAPEVRLADLRNRWEAMGVPTDFKKFESKQALIEFARSMNPTDQTPVTVVLPDPQYEGWLGQILRNRVLLSLKRAFLVQPGIVVVSVPFLPSVEPEPRRLRAPGRLSLIVVVSAVNHAANRAIAYAESLNPSDLKALAVQTDPGEAARLTEEWTLKGIRVPLEIVDSPYRSLVQPLLDQVKLMNPNPEDAVGVVIPEFVVSHWWHNFLHNQTAFLIKTALLFEPNVIVINVPYRVGRAETGRRDPDA